MVPKRVKSANKSDSHLGGTYRTQSKGWTFRYSPRVEPIGHSLRVEPIGHSTRVESIESSKGNLCKPNAAPTLPALW